MSEARTQIFASIRKHLQRGELSAERRTQLEAGLSRPQRNPIPARSQLSHPEQIELFVKMAQEAAATVQRVTAADEVPAAIAEFILRHNLPSDIVLAPAAELNTLPWEAQERLHIQRRKAQNGDRVSVTPVFAGIAETGTLMLLSGAQSPTTLNFLPDVHIALLHAKDIVGPYEDAWDRLRQQQKNLPRTVNLITGPSRSADIEQTLQLGAHGPVQLHIVLIEQEQENQRP
jgi:L-lactate dehydrogenase complex protein LldG